MNMIKIFSHTIVFLLLMPVIFSCQKEQKETSESASKKASPGQPHTDNRVADLLSSMNMHRFTDPVKAPDFELDSVQGDRVRLSGYQGKVVLLSFWATW